jgi:hypothetical protein
MKWRIFLKSFYKHMTPPEHQQSLEGESTQLDQVVEKGIQVALQRVQERFDNNPDQSFDYHNTTHTLNVVNRITEVSKALGFNEKTTALAQLNAAFHDTIQDGYGVSNRYDSILTNEDGQILLSEDKGETSISKEEITREDSEELNPNYGMYKRFTVANEEASFEELAQFLRSEEAEGFFDESDIAISKIAIHGTIPGFDPEKGAITQPNLGEDSTELALALGMVDLGAAGMEGARKLLPEGDANFREEHMKWSFELRHAAESGSLDTIDPDEKAAITQKIIGWTKFQKKIAADQRGFFSERIQWLEDKGTESAKIEALRELFPTFKDEESFQAEIAKIDAKIAEREAMEFEELVKDMYPDIAKTLEEKRHQKAEQAQADRDEKDAQALLKKITGKN